MGIFRSIVVLSAALTLAGCSGGGDDEPPADPPAAEEQQEEAPAETGPVAQGAEFTYPDGLVVTVGNWRERSEPGYEPSVVMALDITARNPTDQPITTTQAWISVRAGDTGTQLQEWTFGPSLDAVLQPGAEETAMYTYDIPETEGHVTATVQWLEATDPAQRPDVEFVVEP